LAATFFFAAAFFAAGFLVVAMFEPRSLKGWEISLYKEPLIQFIPYFFALNQGFPIQVE